jgi:hypothetical protein
MPATASTAAAPRRRVLTLLGTCLGVLLATGSGIATAGPGQPDMSTKEAAPPKATTQYLGSYSHNSSNPLVLEAGAFKSVIARCPAGQIVLGGGGSNNATGYIVMTDTKPYGYDGWIIYAKNNGTVASTITAWAICGS